MEGCLDCNKNCLDPKMGYCVQYDGPDIDAVGITHGMWYDSLTVQLANTLVDYINQRVDLGCLFDNSCGNCDRLSLIPDAVQIIIGKLCSFTAANITYSGGLFCLGGGSISADGVKLLGKGFSYYSSQIGNTSSLGINLLKATEELPAGHSVSKYRVVVSGNKKKGKTLIVDTNEPTSSFTVDNDRYPIVADVNIRINTPSGDVDLNQVIAISNPFSGEKQSSLVVRDFSRSKAAGIDQHSFNELAASQICQNKTEIDQLKNMEIEGCDAIKYPSKDVKAIIGVQSTALCNHEDRIKDLEVVSYKECVCDDCEEISKDLTQQEAWDLTNDLICKLQKEVANLKIELEAVKAKQSCCECP